MQLHHPRSERRGANDDRRTDEEYFTGREKIIPKSGSRIPDCFEGEIYKDLEGISSVSVNSPSINTDSGLRPEAGPLSGQSPAGYSNPESEIRNPSVAEGLPKARP